MDQHITQVEVVDLPRLQEPYPPINYFAAVTPQAKEAWQRYWNHEGQHREITNLDYSRFQHIIPQNKNIIFRDAETKEIVLIVLRDVVSDESLRQEIAGVCQEAIECRSRDRNSGQLSYYTYIDDAERQRRQVLNEHVQTVAGLMWSILRNRMPPGIIAGYDGMVKKYQYPRMADDGTFGFNINGTRVTFCVDDAGLEMPPPLAASHAGYCRRDECGGGSDWAVAYTSAAPVDQRRGGNFFLASYGILVLASGNSIFAWNPRHYHGTTLGEMAELLDYRRQNSNQGSVSRLPSGNYMAVSGNYCSTPTVDVPQRPGKRRLECVEDVNSLPFKRLKVDQDESRRFVRKKLSGIRPKRHSK